MARAGGEGRGTHLQGYLKLKLGYLKKTPDKQTKITQTSCNKTCMIVRQTLELHQGSL